MNKKRGRKKAESLPRPAEEVKADPLPKKHLLRVSEVALYFDVTERTVRNWIEHRRLETEGTPGGHLRITKESIDRWRFQLDSRN